jgi:hypothetical protein
VVKARQDVKTLAHSWNEAIRRDRIGDHLCQIHFKLKDLPLVNGPTAKNTRAGLEFCNSETKMASTTAGSSVRSVGITSNRFIATRYA